MNAIRGDPGVKISDLCRRTDVRWGTAQHHLALLKKAGLVVPRPQGRDCLLFASDYPAATLPTAEALRQGRAGALAAAIAASPGATQKELCERIHLTRKIIRRYVDLLTKAGLVTEQRDAHYRRYYPDLRLTHHLAAQGGSKSAATRAGEATDESTRTA